VGAAPLPGRARQGGGDRGGQAGVGVGGHQHHPRKPPRHEAAEERQPSGAVFGAGDVQAEDLPLAVSVDTGRDQRVDQHRAPALADPHGHRVRLHEPVRPAVQRPGPELLHRPVQALGQHRDLALGQARDPQRLRQLPHPPGRDPQQVAGGHHRNQGLLGAAAALQQPLREIAARPQLRDLQLDRPGPGAPPPLPVAVAVVHPIRARLPIRRPAQRVGFGAHQRLGERLDHRAQQIRTRGLQQLAHPPGKVHTGHIGHRALRSLDEFTAQIEGSARWPSHLRQHAAADQDLKTRYTTSVDVNPRPRRSGQGR
jgi:hypothetical protein